MLRRLGLEPVDAAVQGQTDWNVACLGGIPARPLGHRAAFEGMMGKGVQAMSQCQLLDQHLFHIRETWGKESNSLESAKVEVVHSPGPRGLVGQPKISHPRTESEGWSQRTLGSITSRHVDESMGSGHPQ